MSITRFFEDFLALFYPDICACCATGLMRGEDYICSHCLYELPATNYHKDRENPVAQTFWGRVHIEHATAAYFFRKGNRIQQLIHQVKYKNQKEMGRFLGLRMGKSLCGSGFENIDVVVPVPLHPGKYRKRGYNQSEWIARGIAEALGKPVDTETVVRHLSTDSQTRKKRFDRWENVHSGFALLNTSDLSGKHILLVDDVITTGATIEACAHTILQSADAKVSVAALAVAIYA